MDPIFKIKFYFSLQLYALHELIVSEGVLISMGRQLYWSSDFGCDRHYLSYHRHYKYNGTIIYL